MERTHRILQMKNRRRPRKSISCIRGGGLVTSIAGKVVGTVLNKAVDLLPVELHIPGYQVGIINKIY